MNSYIPSPEYARRLYYDGRYDECKFLATHGIKNLISMYAGRGGSLEWRKIPTPHQRSFASFLDILYWACLNQNDVPAALFYASHLKLTNLYRPSDFDTLVGHVMNKINTTKDKTYRIFLSCAWTDTSSLLTKWSHLFDEIGDAFNSMKSLGYSNGKIRYSLVDAPDDADYCAVMWGSHYKVPLEKTMFFRTEPVYPEKISIGGDSILGDSFSLLRFYDYDDLRYPNLSENWLRTKNVLSKDDNLSKYISAIVSSNYVDPGHKFRVDFIRYIVEVNKRDPLAPGLHIYGYDNSLGFPDDMYKGRLPENDKSLGLFPYRYTLMAENHSIPGYFTEKIVDGILSECLVFYWGCPNLEDIFGEEPCARAFVRLPMDDPIVSYNIVRTAIQEDWWSERIGAIKRAKALILSKLMLKHRIANVIHEEQIEFMFGREGKQLVRLAQAVHPYRYNTRIYPSILYNGARLEMLRDVISGYGTDIRLGSNVSEAPSCVPVIQEFANSYPSDLTNIQTFTINHTRFSIKNFIYPNPPKTFVVNLRSRADRLKRFHQRFPSMNRAEKIWKYERFNAYDGKKILSSNNGSWPSEIEKLFEGNDFGNKPGVIGCALSHLELWKTLLADKFSDYYLIFEDDVEFASNYSWKLYNVMQNITHRWDMIFPGHLVCYDFSTDHRVESEELPKLERMDDYSNPRTSWVGTASYLISKHGAHKLVEYIEKNGINHGIDYLIQLRFPEMRAYGMRPMLNFAHYPSPMCPEGYVDTDVQI